MTDLGKRKHSDISDNTTNISNNSLWRAYVRMPRPDYKRPGISENEFLHHDKELVKAIYEKMIIDEIYGYIESYYEEEIDNFISKPIDYVDKFMDNHANYLFTENYMDVEPIFIFEEYNPQPTTQFNMYPTYLTEEQKTLKEVIQRDEIIGEYFPNLIQPRNKKQKSARK